MKFKHIYKQPWLGPFPQPTPPFLPRRGFWKTVRSRLVGLWIGLLRGLEWSYLEFVYNSKDHDKISLALAASAFHQLSLNPKPDKAQPIFDQAVATLGDYSDVLERGSLEWHGWREAPNSLQAVAFISWVPKTNSWEPSTLPIFRIFFPTMQIIQRDVEARSEHYEPPIDIPKAQQEDSRLFNTQWPLVLDEEFRVTLRTLLSSEVSLKIMITTTKRLLDTVRKDERFKKLESV